MTLDFRNLLAEWDSMFLETVDPTRERRMEAILSALGTRARSLRSIIDLGAGPGPLSARILERFPRSRVVALDTDPTLLEVGKRALSRHGSRLTWVQGDLREDDWSTALPSRSTDAVVSSLVLHWLEEAEIRQVYRNLRRIVRPAGVVITGDFLPSRPSTGGESHPLRASATGRQAADRKAQTRAFKRRWERWWGSLRSEPSLSAAIAKRRARIPGDLPPRRTSGPKVPASIESHVQALRDAGFSQTEQLWREREFHVLLGRK